MIEVENLTKKFGKLVALNNVSLSLKNGQSISLIGPNGSGKTTFIKSLLGLVVADKGTIVFDGTNIVGNSDYRSKIGYMPQIGRFPENIRIEQLFDMIRDIRKSHGLKEDHELIETYGLDKMKDKTMRTLSGGTRQKVSACLAFLFNPPVIILDEPTAGLDPLSAEQLKEKILAEKNKGKLILITSHILSDLDEITSEVIYMQDGDLLFHKSIDELRNDTGEEKLARAIASVMKKNAALVN
ncbi:MAG: ABC transporter ATP-binding protein [Bacteroidetes bacterium]|jgi:Cu-processing system ATP-binding protein|nr:ABC transporter ATP-binding protein [Bacteroidota bacterium]